jgi:YfiR/HmsC-like
MRYVKIFFLISVLCLYFTASGQTTNYQVYALFVVNIVKYSSFPNPGTDLQLAVYGKSKVYEELLKQNGKNVSGRTLKVVQAESVTDLNQAQVIYLADGRSAALDEIVKATEGKPVLIICEREGLFKRGAGFSFIITENSTLRFDINNTELEKRLIKISKSLTALANSMI